MTGLIFSTFDKKIFLLTLNTFNSPWIEDRRLKHFHKIIDPFLSSSIILYNIKTEKPIKKPSIMTQQTLTQSERQGYVQSQHVLSKQKDFYQKTKSLREELQKQNLIQLLTFS